MATLATTALLLLAPRAEGFMQGQCDPFNTYSGLCYSGPPVQVKTVSREECCDLVASGEGDTFNYFASNSSCHLIRGYVGTYSCDGELGFAAPVPAPPPPPFEANIVYHLFEPKYTGLANKDCGDFKGDMGFIFGTFQKYFVGNPEASMEHNIIEMSEVNVTGWGQYEECNAPGAVGAFTCPNGTEYCCTTGLQPPVPANHTRDQLPGLEASKLSLGVRFGFGGWWFSFPKESEGRTWSQRVLRRVAGKCVGDAWRADAGGCGDCGEELDSCVADCIKSVLAVNGSTELLQKTWDRVFADQDKCPDVPFPEQDVVV
jgi:hypothetical protein